MKQEKTAQEQAIDIGIPVEVPKGVCKDINCPFHGSIKLHGRIFEGIVIRNVFHKTATIEFQRQHYIQKFERYEKRRTRIKVHVPECLAVKKGDYIKVVETRPLSKTKNFVAVEIYP